MAVEGVEYAIEDSYVDMEYLVYFCEGYFFDFFDRPEELASEILYLKFNFPSRTIGVIVK